MVAGGGGLSSLACGGLRLERRGALDGVLLMAELGSRGGGPGFLWRSRGRGGCVGGATAGAMGEERDLGRAG